MKKQGTVSLRAYFLLEGRLLSLHHLSSLVTSVQLLRAPQGPLRDCHSVTLEEGSPGIQP